MDSRAGASTIGDAANLGAEFRGSATGHSREPEGVQRLAIEVELPGVLLHRTSPWSRPVFRTPAAARICAAQRHSILQYLCLAAPSTRRKRAFNVGREYTALAIRADLR
jgi:hypothetical protein